MPFKSGKVEQEKRTRLNGVICRKSNENGMTWEEEGDKGLSGANVYFKK